MKKLLLCGALALVLTVPVSIGIARTPWLIGWFSTGSGWDTLGPLLRAVGSIGPEEDENVFLAVLLGVSFIVSMGISALLVAGASRLRNRARSTSRPK